MERALELRFGITHILQVETLLIYLLVLDTGVIGGAHMAHPTILLITLHKYSTPTPIPSPMKRLGEN